MIIFVVFYALAALLIFLGWKSLRGGFRYLRYFEREFAKEVSTSQPFATIFVPCRGLDQALEDNLRAVTEQDYAEFEIIFIVDDPSDDSVRAIEKIRSLNPLNKLFVAGKADAEGQKVHNLRKAISFADSRSKIFAFVDSDARVRKDWLRHLAAPLAEEKVGCATGYRWFVAPRADVAGQLRSVWNASIASALGPERASNFCWGGSMAIRRSVFEKLNMPDRWRGTLSDDFAMTRAVKTSGLEIYFVPQCLSATVESTGFVETLEFTTRQMKITKIYARKLWIASFIGSALFSITFWGGIGLLFFADGINFVVIAGALSVIFALGAAKSLIRLKAVRMALPIHSAEIRSSGIWHLTLWTITPLLYFYNCLCALLSNEILWRGIRYKLISAEETAVIRTNKEG